MGWVLGVHAFRMTTDSNTMVLSPAPDWAGYCTVCRCYYRTAGDCNCHAPQRAAPQPAVPPYVPYTPYTPYVPYTPPFAPWTPEPVVPPTTYPWGTAPYIGDPPYSGTTITIGDPPGTLVGGGVTVAPPIATTTPAPMITYDSKTGRFDITILNNSGAVVTWDNVARSVS